MNSLILLKSLASLFMKLKLKLVDWIYVGVFLCLLTCLHGIILVLNKVLEIDIQNTFSHVWLNLNIKLFANIIRKQTFSKYKIIFMHFFINIKHISRLKTFYLSVVFLFHRPEKLYTAVVRPLSVLMSAGTASKPCCKTSICEY